MTLDFLRPEDRTRVSRVLQSFAKHHFSDFDLTGSLALGIHGGVRTTEMIPRPLNDVDIVVDSFESVPERLAEQFLVLHIHPYAPHGKILVQLAETDAALRIDIFRARAATRSRTRQVNTKLGAVRIVSIADLAARTAAILMGLARSRPVPLKFSEEFNWLCGAAAPDAIEAAWEDHRSPDDPSTFEVAHSLILENLKSRNELLVMPVYSQDVDAACPKCEERGRWRLSPKREIVSVLGYV